MTAANKPFGLRDVKLAEYGSGSTTYDVPVAARLSFKDTPGSTAELRGDDELVAIHVMEGKVVVELEAGGIDLKTWSLLSGGTYATGSGYYKVTKSGSDNRPYLILGGKVIDNAGTGDVHVYLPYCRCVDGPGGEFRDGQFYLTQATIEGLDDNVTGMYVIRENDTASDLNLETFV